MKNFKDLREELSEGLVGNLVKHKSDLKKMQDASAYHDKMQDHHGEKMQKAADDDIRAQNHHSEKSYEHLRSQEHVDNAIDAHKKRNYKERHKHLSLYHKSRASRDYQYDRHMSGKKDGGLSSIGNGK